VVRWLKRLISGAELPEGFDGSLDADERVLTFAAVAGGGFLVPTSLGLWVPADATAAAPIADAATAGAGEPGHCRIGWHLVSKATWDGRALSVVEADELGPAEGEDGAMLIADRTPRRYPLAEPGQVPQVVHDRVTRSVLHSEPAAGGGLRVQRKVPGRDGIQVQLRRSST
jgi:hypothetical protein